MTDLEPASALASVETPEAFALRVEKEATDDELRLDERDLIRMIKLRDAAAREPLERQVREQGATIEDAKLMLGQQAVRIASLEAQLASAPRWIPAEERMPEEGVKVLASAFGEDHYVASCRKDMAGLLRWWTHNSLVYASESYGVTHWQPLPEPPPAAQKEPL